MVFGCWWHICMCVCRCCVYTIYYVHSVHHSHFSLPPFQFNKKQLCDSRIPLGKSFILFYLYYNRFPVYSSEAFFLSFEFEPKQNNKQKIGIVDRSVFSFVYPAYVNCALNLALGEVAASNVKCHCSEPNEVTQMRYFLFWLAGVIARASFFADRRRRHCVSSFLSSLLYNLSEKHQRICKNHLFYKIVCWYIISNERT